MNPEQQKNYWQKDPQETVEATLPDSPVSQTPELATEPVATAETTTKEEVPVIWTANEYISLEKNSLWYVIFALVAIALIAGDIFLLKSYTFSILVVVMAVSVVIYSRRPPRTIQYTLSAKQGLYVGERLYNFADFKSFGLIRDAEHHSIMLIPTKRFSPGVSVYFPEEFGERIVDILGSRLPMESLKLDVIDVLVRKLRL